MNCREFMDMSRMDQLIFTDKLLTAARSEKFFKVCKNLITKAEQAGVYDKVNILNENKNMSTLQTAETYMG